jgi:hypothetical protein
VVSSRYCDGSSNFLYLIRFPDLGNRSLNSFSDITDYVGHRIRLWDVFASRRPSLRPGPKINITLPGPDLIYHFILFILIYVVTDNSLWLIDCFMRREFKTRKRVPFGSFLATSLFFLNQ